MGVSNPFEAGHLIVDVRAVRGWTWLFLVSNPFEAGHLIVGLQHLRAAMQPARVSNPFEAGHLIVGSTTSWTCGDLRLFQTPSKRGISS